MRGWGIAQIGAGSMRTVASFPSPGRPSRLPKKALGISDHDDLDLGNLLSRVGEAKAIATFIEMRDGTVKVNMRARPGYNVAQIAYDLGGGHRQASGCTIDGPLDVAVDRVLAKLQTSVDPVGERPTDRR